MAGDCRKFCVPLGRCTLSRHGSGEALAEQNSELLPRGNQNENGPEIKMRIAAVAP
jgi:hypothetical protein